ncbi:hypothetical protein ACRQ5D_20930 [Mucilaginibacter sp. P25]|uniref:Entericidin n=2 Tax=Mucilaginibacter TaxID=423349 RepID=A0AAE6JF11_9SPHI|nr:MULTISPECIES: hypothetical protein [Mucilaginibacter]QEM04393.1 hypothetical protein DIU31_013070 [Mucilaginibacter rubeus]QEM16991.1 hypothetical protein DIU38_013200 [Mucilaginibacter gossypii]QTE38026.1 hypothetical protein J3L18_02835 [Mucilaginibacter gossypii]QTE46516.1 hypothetical protein J3L19_14530 [Mucilaginibacter rubeus]QTE53113.1 hypothetical protein J3L21_14505 [Mucilaginibacter rubeus]
MKNTFKLAFVALVLAASFSACGGDAKKTDGDTTKTTVVDSTKVVTDSTKTDTTKVVADTTKKDTTKK